MVGGRTADLGLGIGHVRGVVAVARRGGHELIVGLAGSWIDDSLGLRVSPIPHLGR